MKTLGLGLKSLLKDPRWALKHNIDPNNQTAGQVSGGGNKAQSAEESTFKRAKSGDINNINNIFAQSRNAVNGVNAGNDIFSQSKIGGIGENKNIFEMMNKIDEQHKPLIGAQGMQPTENVQQMNYMNPEELQKKLGKKLNMLM